MRNFITIAEEHNKILNEATFDKELDGIVAKVLRGSAGHSKGKMINRDAVLNKGFDMALALDDGKDDDNIFTGIKNFVVTDDFLERQYFGKIAKRLGLKGMFMNNGRYVTTDVDEYDRYELGRGDNDDAVEQNNKGLLPGSVAKKFKIDLKFKGAADDKMDKDSKPDKEWRIQSNGKRGNFNIDRDAPFVDEVKDGKKIRTYGSVDQLKKMFGDDADIRNHNMAPNLDSGPMKSHSDAGKEIGGITITDDNAMKYIRRYNELMKKAQKDEVMYANINFKSVFGDLYKQLNEEKLSADEEKELQDIVDAMQKALKDGNLYTDALKRDMQEIVDNWKYDKEIAIAAEKEKAKQSFDAAADAAKKKAGDVASKTDAGKDAEKLKLPPGYRIEKIIDKKTLKPTIMIYKGDTLIGQYNVRDDDKDEDIRKGVIKIAQMDADASSSKVASDTDAGQDKDAEGGFPGDPAIYGLDDDGSVPGSKKTPRGALEKFSKSGKGGLANDTDEVDAIKELQQRLKEMGIDTAIDGKYGKGTVDAVKRVQEMLGAKQDGDAGPNTIGAILKMGNIPGIITFYDDLKRMAELSKQVKTESQEFRYFMNVLEGGNLLEALSAAEQKEYADLLAKHKAKFDDPEYQMSLPKSVKDLMGQVIKNDPKGVASDTQAGQGADAAGKGRFIPLPDNIKEYLGLPPSTFYIDTLMDKNEGDFYIVKDPVSKKDVQRSITGGPTVYVRNTQTMARISEPEGKMIKEFLDGQNIPYGNKEVVQGFPESGSEDLSTPLSDAKPEDLRGTDVKPGSQDQDGGVSQGQDEIDADDDSMQSKDDASKDADDASKGADAQTSLKQAEKLYQAMKGGTGIGTDEDSIFEVFGQITTRQQYEAIRQAYKDTYNRDLFSDLEGEISPGEEYKKDGKVIGTAQTLIFDKISNLGKASADGSTVGTPKASADKTADTTDTSQKVGQPMGSAAASEKTTQTVQMGKGDWPRISKELGFASVQEFVAYQRKYGNADMKDAINNPTEYLNKPFEFMPNNAVATKTDAGQSADANTSQSATADAGGVSASANVKPVEPRPTSQGGRNRRQDRWDKLYGATHNPDGSPKNESKEYDMTKKVNEAASMNISMNGDNSAEVAELVALLRNAGMEKAEPVSDMPMYKDKHDDMVSKIQMMDPEQGPMDSPSPCGMGEEDVGEEWDNSPDEEYRDDDYMTRDIAGGLNRPKPPGALRAKDPAIHNEDVDKYKSELRKGLEDLYKTI